MSTTVLNSKKIRIDSMHVYLGNISAFILIPTFLFSFPLSIAGDVLARSGMVEMSHVVTIITSASGLLYFSGLFALFPPLVLLPGFVNGLIFDQLQSRDLKLQFLKRDPLLQKIILMEAPSTMLTLGIFGLIGLWGLITNTSSSPSEFFDYLGENGMLTFTITFPIVVVVITILMSTYTYFYWKKFGIVYLPEKTMKESPSPRRG